MVKLFFISFLLFIGFSAKTQVVDKIVAQVGDEIILLSNLQALKLQMIQENTVDLKDASSISNCKLVEDLMYQNLLLNQARLDSLPVSDEQVDSEMENRLRYIISSMPGGKDQFEKFYGKSITQIKEDFRVIIRNQILARDMQQKITSSITVTPKEVETYFKALPKDSVPYINMKLAFQQIVYFPKLSKADKYRTYN